MAGIQMFANQLLLLSPHTFNALQKLVTAMADVSKNAGKKTIFGKDKGQEAYSKFLFVLKTTFQSMVLDGAIEESTPTTEAITVLEEKIRHFSMAYPNWLDAYKFANQFFSANNMNNAVAVIERLRSTP